ncbi:MAG TPA: hypothetical protein VHA30_01750, partial [Patescibacteria group bacterium]|nr:hypothetical protein [Patescibacteria group bacterium]
LFAGYLLLQTINPDLTEFHSIQPAQVTPSTPGTGTSGGTGNGGGGTCKAASSGIISPANLQGTCFGNNAQQASMIANKESGGNPTIASGTDICHDQNGNVVMLNGKPVSVSWGLFQINLTAHPIGNLNCPSAFSAMYTSKNHVCVVTNPTRYQQCVAAATNASTNIQTACQLSNNGQNWSQWANECGF